MPRTIVEGANMTGRRWIAIGLLLAVALAMALILFMRRGPPPAPIEPAPPSLGLVERSIGPEAGNKISVRGQSGRGTRGDDKLMDKAGGATLVGLGGNDTYQAPDEKTRIVEQPGEGLDTVETWNSFKLPANVENLVLVGRWTTGTASEDGSMLMTKGADNVLESGPGSDTLVADAGSKRTVFLFHRRSGIDAILNFKADGEAHDMIRLTYDRLCSFEQVRRRLSRSGANDTLLTLGPRDKILIRGVLPQALRPEHFLLCFSPSTMPLMFEDQFDVLSLYDRTSRSGRWKTAYTHAPADGPESGKARKLAGNKDEQIYVDPAYAGNPAVSRAPLGLNPFRTEGGQLTIRAWRLPAATSAKLWNARYASGLLTSEPSFAQTYGYFEVRAELPQVKGMFPAFWLLPTSRKWPPEIDIMENVGQDFVTCGLITDDTRRAFFLRYRGGVKGMHRYGVLWTPTRIQWVFDGEVVGAVPTPPSMKQPMYMLLNLAVGGNWPGSPAADFRSAEMKVDYIRAYRWEPPR